VKVLIAGSSGFIGQELTAQLIAAGHSVLEVGRSKMVHSKNEFIDSELMDFERKILDAQPDYAIDLVTEFNLNPKSEEFPRFINSMLAFHIKLARALEPLHTPLIYVGSFWQRLSTPPSDYHYFKRLTEDVLRDRTTLRITAVDFLDTYSFNDPRGKLISTLLTINPEELNLNLSQGEQYLNLLHVSDAAQALVHVVENSKSIHADESGFTAADSEFYQLRNVVEMIERTRGVKFKINWGALNYRPGEFFTPPSIQNPIRGWKPKYSFLEHVEKSVS
jgi:nucleoside-diphosphate-sugar epimerase